MGAQEGPELVADDVEKALGVAADAVDELEFQVMLGGRNDRSKAFVQVTAGAGGAVPTAGTSTRPSRPCA